MKATNLRHDLGWLDNITRDPLKSGTLNRYIADLSVTGLTSNPTLFENATKKSTAYDATIREKLSQGKTSEALFFELAQVDDVELGGGNAKNLTKLPPRCRTGDNAYAFMGGFRLWETGQSKPVHGRRPSRRT